MSGATTDGDTTVDTSAVDTSAVTVEPETFTLVDYDSAAIAHVAARVWEQIGLPAGQPLHVEVDESTPLGRAWVKSVDPVVLTIESGGLEHNHRPRQFDGTASAQLFGRLLLRVRDRLDPAFGDAPGDDDLTLAQSAAWDAYAMGRVARLGYDSQRPRRQYQFRVRHGFSDVTDAAFDQLWNADGLSWADVDRLSSAARAEV